MTSGLRVTWAYSLRKEDLNSYLTEFGCEVEGTVEEQRKRFAMFLVEYHDPECHQRLLQLQAKHERPTSDVKPVTPRKNTQTPSLAVDDKSPIPSLTLIPGAEDAEANTITTLLEVPGHTMRTRKHATAGHTSRCMDMRDIMDQVRKWGVSYDGEREPWEFVERLEELADMYEIPTDRMAAVMPEVLTGKALVWYRNNHGLWKTWAAFRSDFLGFFLPPRYIEHLEEEIRKRRQRPRETFKNYMLHMQNLMRHSSYTEEQRLERIFTNALPEYLWYIRRKDFRTIHELLEMAGDMESIPAPSPVAREHHRRMEPAASQQLQRPPVNPRTACRRCGQDGHFAVHCQNEQYLFCWDCGRPDVRTIHCCRRGSGNANRARITRGGTGPQLDKPLN